MKYIKTLREIFQNPGAVIDSFVFEEKTKFQHPFSFGIIGIAVVILLNTLLVNVDPAIDIGEIGSESDQMSQLNYWIAFSKMKASIHFLPVTIFLLLIPSLTLPGLFFFREDIEGFYTNFILNSYAVGASVLIIIVMIPAWWMGNSAISYPVLHTYLPLIFLGIAVVRIYEKYFLIDTTRGWIRIISSYIIGCILFLLLKSFSTAIVGYFIFAVNRFLDIWMTV